MSRQVRFLSSLLVAVLLFLSAGQGLSLAQGLQPAENGTLGDKGAPKPAAETSSLPSLADRDANKLADDLDQALAAAKADAQLDVIVQFAGTAAAGAFAAAEQAAGPIAYRARWDKALSGFSASLTHSQIAALQKVPAVSRIEPDRPVRAFLNTAAVWTGVQQARSDYGVNGDRDGNPATYSKNDVVVAIIDTGIDPGHVDLDGGKIIGWRDEVNGRASPYDDHGHGTHVASIATGTGEGNSAYTGVAPGAALVGIKVLNSSGSGTTTQIINGINWMIANKNTYNIRVANMSLGASGCSDGTDSLSVAVNNAVAAGIVMAVAAGNDGPATCTVGTPAAAADAITVGAAYDPGELGWAIAEFSSRGPTADGRIKPDIVTPGRYITAAQAGTSSGYVTYSGTSMATPFLAGVVALMLDANYNLSPADVKNILYATGKYEDRGPAGKDVDFGYGLNLSHAAVKAAGGFSSGSYDDGLQAGYGSGSLSGTGAYQDWTVTVSSTTAPLAVTLIMTNWTGWRWPDFDLYVYDPSGNLVGQSLGTTRQELVRLTPSVTGTYKIRVTSYTGSGPYYLDVTYR